MKKSLILLLICQSLPSFASMNSRQFLNCFVKASNEVIAENRAGDNEGRKVRICRELSQKNIDAFLKKLSVIEDGQIKYYSAKAMNELRLIDLYDYLKNEMNCYGNKVKDQNGSLVGAFVNSASYHRNLDLTEEALNRMAGVEMWDKAFSPSGYKYLNEFDFSYCEQE